MKFERLGSGQILCTMSKNEVMLKGLSEDDAPAEIEAKLKRIAEDVLCEAEEEFGEDAFNDDGRTIITRTDDNVYFGIMTDKEKYTGLHMNDISKAISQREKHIEEEAYPLDECEEPFRIEEFNGIEEFTDEMPDPITELKTASMSFRRLGDMMSFLKANRHLCYIMSYAYKDMNGRYIFALKAPDEDSLAITKLKAAEFGADPIQYSPSIEYMDEHYKKINVISLVALS